MYYMPVRPEYECAICTKTMQEKTREGKGAINVTGAEADSNLDDENGEEK